MKDRDVFSLWRMGHGPCGAAVLVASCSLLSVVGRGDPRPSVLPPALRSIAAQRGRWRTGRIEYVITGDHRWNTPRFFEAAFAGPDVLVTDRGDADGIIARYSDGDPQPYGFGPAYSLLIDDRTWSYVEGQVVANLFEHSNIKATFDLRTLGLSYQFHGGRIKDAMRGGATEDAPVQYDVSSRHERTIVRGDTGHGVVTWVLDRTAGGLPQRVTFEVDGHVAYESRTELQQYGDIWYPARVEYYRDSWQDGKAPYQVVEVLSLDVDPPDIPARLAPGDIHIDAGLNVQVRDIQALGRPPRLMKWSGDDVVTLDQFAAAFNAGKIQPGPYFLQNIGRAQAMMALHRAHEAKAAEKEADSPAPASHPSATQLDLHLSAWETYTARFIARYRLDDKQTQQAIAILRDCQQQAQQVAARFRAGQPARTADGSKSADGEHSSDAGRQNPELVRKLEALFNRQLKPRLERLPTRQQRRMVENPPTKKLSKHP